MTVFINKPKLYCMREFFKLNRDNWFMIRDGKKIPNKDWREYFCPLHKKNHLPIKTERILKKS